MSGVKKERKKAKVKTLEGKSGRRYRVKGEKKKLVHLVAEDDPPQKEQSKILNPNNLKATAGNNQQ